MMLVYKIWRESQVRFLSAAAVLSVYCIFLIAFPALAGSPAPVGEASFREYINSQIFEGLGKGLFVLLIIFLGMGGLLRERGRHTAVFTLSLPVSRTRLMGTQIAVALAELLLLALLPALLLQLLSPLVDRPYPLADALRFGLLRFVCGAVIVATTFLLSVLLKGEYTAVVGCYLALALDGMVSNLLRPYPTNILRILDARWEQRVPDLSGPLPWMLLSILLLIALTLFAAATRITERQEV